MHICQEVSAIPVPNEISVVCFEGSAIFIPAPVLRNATLALNTQDLFKRIPLMRTTAKAINAVHENNGNMIRGGIEIFLLLGTHFPPEKKGFCGTQHNKQKRPRKNKLRFVARPKLPRWLFPLLKMMPPPP
jgi:hypothetical protein